MAKKKKSTTRKKQLPAALAKRDVAAAKNKLARIREAARADIALILAKRVVIEDAFLDIGEALKRLKPRAVWRALGRKSFAHLCEQDLQMGATHATMLVDIVTRIPREAAMRLREDRAGAVTEILRALPPNMAAAADALAHGKPATLAKGRRIDPLRTTADALREVAKELRHAKAPAVRRGRTTTPEERELAKRAQRALHDPVVEALATTPGRPAHARITLVDVVRLRDVGRALAKLSASARPDR